VKMLALILADGFTENKDDTINLWRAGLDEYRVTAFPATMQLHLLIRIELEPEDVRPLHWVQIRVLQAGHEVLPWQRMPISISKRDVEGRARVNMMSNLGFTSIEAGEGMIEASFDDIGLPLLRFRVTSTP